MNKKKIAVAAFTLFLICLTLCYGYRKMKIKESYRMREYEINLPEETTSGKIEKTDVGEDEYTAEDWEADKKRLREEAEAELAAREEYSSVDQDGNALYYEGMVPNDYDLSWDMMLSYLNDSGRQIFDEETEAGLPDNIKAYLGYAALRFNEANHIEDVYSLDPENSVISNINNDIITYRLQGQFSQLEVTVDFYNERVHVERSMVDEE
ncbi:MAG: hypothetical protein NC412_01595 [Roseburia sp.]|nr:hypothetical protein [Roseburia sp.]MCM1277951.1 hypothetical protein [Robinsoniella sp.]